MQSFLARRRKIVLGFINPVVDSDDEDHDIFEPERSFAGVFNTFFFFSSFLSKWCVEKDRNVLMYF